MLRVSAEQSGAALQVLQESRYTLNESRYQPQATSRSTSDAPARSSVRSDAVAQIALQQVSQPLPVQASEQPSSPSPPATPSVPNLEQLNQSRAVLATSVQQIVNYFEQTGLPEIRQSDGMRVNFDPETMTMTATTAGQRTLAASVETRSMKTNFTEVDIQSLARLAEKTQQALRENRQEVSSQPKKELEIG